MKKWVIGLLVLSWIGFLTACSPVKTVSQTGESTKQELIILAAASLNEPFQEIAAAFEAQNADVKLIFSFAGSQELAQQLEQGAPADVFASANQKYMQSAVDADRVATAAAQNFVTNQLTVILPKNNPAGITDLKDLTTPGLKIVLAAAEVPVGKYTLEVLDKLSADAAYTVDFKDLLLSNVASYENNVKSVVSKVALGEADAGIVYTSDTAGSASPQLEQIVIPTNLNVVAVYPIAVIKDSTHAQTAQSFVDFVLSAESQVILAKYGFLPPAAE
ncbi:MAG: molybdate ABC transporter substrate-binding protein [Chloroflexi bacterium HGW-Chloroflexi-10]|nr:MAG: molybdate ABC transporter substrate-binding protein [Chloroflexi bacterium HGW-Chloroflexi-10]